MGKKFHTQKKHTTKMLTNTNLLIHPVKSYKHNISHLRSNARNIKQTKQLREKEVTESADHTRKLSLATYMNHLTPFNLIKDQIFRDK